MSNHLTPERRTGHCAVSLGNFIIIIGGQYRHKISTRVIWSYNLYTEEWRKHEIPKTSCAPEPLSGAVATAFDKTIYTFGGLMTTGELSNAVWKLSKTKEGCFTWSTTKPQCEEKSPSPRIRHTGWEYAGKIWTFAGCGRSPEGYLNDNGDIESSILFAVNNQLLCFDPNIETWTNPQCFGSIPTPRSGHASAIINDTVWIFGGNTQHFHPLGDMFELRMHSLMWSKIQTAQFHPKARAYCTLTATADDKLVLHGGLTDGQTLMPMTSSDTWIIDLTSHAWRQFTSRKDHPRKFHTGSTGLNHSVIIIGGNRSPLDPYDTYDMHNIIFNVKLEPKSLKQMALQAIFKYRNELPVNRLPAKLLSVLDISTKDQNVCS